MLIKASTPSLLKISFLIGGVQILAIFIAVVLAICCPFLPGDPRLLRVE